MTMTSDLSKQNRRQAPRFSQADGRAASDEWTFNCGPGALCGVLNMTPTEIRPHLLDFETKGYTNPTLMFDILKGLQIRHRLIARTDDPTHPTIWPRFGLCRVQWHGPWTRPGVPMKVRYRQTHWIGVSSEEGGRMIFDINAMQVGGWITEETWSSSLVPWLLPHVSPKADGRWHLTHSIEIPA